MIYDLHNDFLTGQNGFSFDENAAECALSAVSEQAKRIVFAVWTTRQKDPATFLYRLKRLKQRLGLTVAVEDLGYIKPEKLGGALKTLLGLRPLYASLTWNDENVFAGGAYTTVGLSSSGKAMIEVLGKNGILLDTAHLSRLAFYQAVDAGLSYSDNPIICSHTCFSGINPHPRNLSDDQIRLIIASGGIIGLTLVPEFMGKQTATTADVARQIDYFAQRFGIDSLCIGSDFFGTGSPAVKNYGAFRFLRKRLEGMGYSGEDIDRIFFQNATEFVAALKPLEKT